MLRCGLCGALGTGAFCSKCGSPLTASAPVAPVASGPGVPVAPVASRVADPRSAATPEADIFDRTTVAPFIPVGTPPVGDRAVTPPAAATSASAAPPAAGAGDTVIAPIDPWSADTYRPTGRTPPVPPSPAAPLPGPYGSSPYASYLAPGYQAETSYVPAAVPAPGGAPYGQPAKKRSVVVPLVIVGGILALIAAGGAALGLGLFSPPVPTTVKPRTTVTVVVPPPAQTQAAQVPAAQPPAPVNPVTLAPVAPNLDALRQQCVAVRASDVEGCVRAYSFLRSYERIDEGKNMARSDIPNWWTQPASYYGQTVDLDQLQAKLTTPTKPGTVYSEGTLTGFSPSVSLGTAVGTELTFNVPYVEDGASKSVQVVYVLVPGPGANPYRITKVYEP